MDSDKWKEKFGNFLSSCQEELKKTTEIGRKMLSASKINTEMQENFEELGRYAKDQIKAKKLDWNDEKVGQLLDKIKVCEEKLEGFEDGVRGIKSQQRDS